MAVCQTNRGRSPCRKVNHSCLGKYVGLAALERARASDTGDEEPSGGGLDFGITSWHIRILTENPWNGGAGYTYAEASKMTPDQIYHRICERDILKIRNGKRVAKVASPSVDAEGRARVRVADGSSVLAKATGPSLAKQIKDASLLEG